MEIKHNGFVSLPLFLNFKECGLNYRDALIYLTIRSFCNSEDRLCFPSYETIMERSSMSRGFVANSIKRLEKSGYIKVTRAAQIKMVNRYSFPDIGYTSPIPNELFWEMNLTPCEKAMLLCLRQFVITMYSMELGKSIKEISKSLGLSYKVVYTQMESLKSKGFLGVKERKMAQREKKWHYLTDALPWQFELLLKPEPEKEKLGVLLVV